MNNSSLFDAKFLFASLIWGSIGGGYWLYGKKQRSTPAMVGGAAMVSASYFIDSALLMTLVCIGLIVGVYYWIQNED